MQLFPQNSKVPATARVDLAMKVKKFVDHCRIIHDHSPSSDYKVRARLTAIDQIMDTLYPMLRKPENYSVKDICHFTLLRHDALHRMLPLMSNRSYESSVQKLDDIINECKNIIQSLQHERNQRIID